MNTRIQNSYRLVTANTFLWYDVFFWLMSKWYCTILPLCFFATARFHFKTEDVTHICCWSWFYIHIVWSNQRMKWVCYYTKYYFNRHRHWAQLHSAETPVLYVPAVPVERGMYMCECVRMKWNTALRLPKHFRPGLCLLHKQHLFLPTDKVTSLVANQLAILRSRCCVSPRLWQAIRAETEMQRVPWINVRACAAKCHSLALKARWRSQLPSVIFTSVYALHLEGSD